MLWQPLVLILMTVSIGFSGLLLNWYKASQHIYHTNLAKYDLVVTTRAASKYLAGNSSTLMKAVKYYLVNAKNDHSGARSRLISAFNSFKSRLDKDSSNSVHNVVLRGLHNSDFIAKYYKSLGLHVDKQKIDSITYELNPVQSAFFEPMSKSNKHKYKSTIISEDKVQNSNPELGYYDEYDFEYDYFPDGDLVIHPNLLNALVDSDSALEIEENQGEHHVDIEYYGLNLEHFPDSVDIDYKVPNMEA